MGFLFPVLQAVSKTAASIQALFILSVILSEAKNLYILGAVL